MKKFKGLRRAYKRSKFSSIIGNLLCANVNIIIKGDDIMGRKTTDRTGERNINNFGSEMIIVGYRTNKDIDVYFSEYNYIVKNKRYHNFKKGNIRCPYERSTYGIGCIGEGDYRVSENGKITRVYNTWHNMLQRCYDEEYHEKYPTYIGCKTDENWHNFQNFGEWDSENYYEVEGQQMHLDKDILVKHNKIYSPETCIYVPQAINKLFVKNDKNRGESAIGTNYHKRDKIYQTHCSIINPETGKSKYEYLGIYETEIEAFEVYKCYKERNIKEIADYFKKEIPVELYDALYKYEVEITD